MNNRRQVLAALAALASAEVWAQEVSQPSLTPEQLREAMKTQLPPPPEGFAWQIYKNAVFPKPAGWTERELAAPPSRVTMSTYATSPEAFSQTKPFETGFTVQIITGSKRTLNFEARRMALAYVKPFLDSHRKDEILILEQKPNGDFEQTFFRYRDAPPGLKPVIVHKFILANDKADTVHIFTFESPAETWDANWSKFGTPILSRVNVVPQAAAN